MQQGNFPAVLESVAHVEKLVGGDDPIANIPQYLHLELAQALRLKGWGLFATGDLEGALKLADRVLGISETAGDRSLTAKTRSLLGAIRGTMGEYQSAANDFEHALHISGDLGDRNEAMFQLNNLGVIDERLGDYHAALKRYQEALKHAQEIGNRVAEMSYLSNLGEARVRLEDYQAAEADLCRAIDMSELAGRGATEYTLLSLAEAYLGQDKISKATETAQRALEKGLEVQSQEAIVATWRVLGMVAARIGKPIAIAGSVGSDHQPYDAVACFTESDRLATETKLEDERARTLREWARFEIEKGDRIRGEMLWKKSRDIFARLGAVLEAERMQSLPG
jgi:tetratricopeptide (TPR) repeat protein